MENELCESGRHLNQKLLRNDTYRGKAMLEEDRRRRKARKQEQKE
jgi:hypothetical protein